MFQSQLWLAEMWSQTVSVFCCHKNIQQQTATKLQWHIKIHLSIMHPGSVVGQLVALLIFSGFAHISRDWGNVGDSSLFHMSLLLQQASPGMFSRWWRRHKSSKWKHTRLHQHHDSPSLYRVQLAKTHHKPTPMSQSPLLVREMQWHTCRESERLVPLIQSLPHPGLGWARHEPCAHTWDEM